MAHGNAVTVRTAANRAAGEPAAVTVSGVGAGLRQANRLAERCERQGLLPFAALSLVYWGLTSILAARKLMWNDELYTYYIAVLPSMSDVWTVLRSGGDQMPPFFYLTTRLALDLVGINNLSVRLPEMLGFWVMSACLFVFVARRTSSFPALCAAAFPLVTVAYYYAYEARPYGLVLGFGALALLCWQAVTLDRRRVLSLVCLAASLAAAVSTHYYAVFIILPLAVGEALRNLMRRRVDVAVWTAFVVPVVPLALHRPLIRAGTAYSEAFWAPPQWVNVPDFYHYLLAPAVVPVAVILVLSAIHATVAGDHRPTSGAGPALAPPLHEVAAACGFIVIPFVSVILAKVATGAFVNRYALPAVIGFAVLAGFGAAIAFRRHPLMRLVAAACLGGWFVLSQARELIEPTGFSLPVRSYTIERPAEWLAAQPDRDLPVVVADPHTFTVLSHYGPPAITSRIVYLADPGLALKHLGHNSVERGMLDLIRPWFRMNVVEFQPFVAEQSRFLVYGDFVRLAFLNWLLPELHARGMRTELLNRAGDNLLLLVYRENGPVGAAESRRSAASPE